MRRKMRYLNERSNGSYRYVRDYPLSVQRAFPKHPKQYSRELDLKSTCTDSELHKAMDESARVFELNVKIAKNSDVEAFTESERRLAMDEILRQRKLKPGMYSHVEDPESWEDWEVAGKPLFKTDLADRAIPEFDEIVDKSKKGTPANFRQEVLADAWQVIQKTPEFRRRKTMREAWSEYLERGRIDVSKGDGRKKQQRFERVLAHTGDFIISDETKDDVLDRVQNFVTAKQRDNPNIKPQSIERELAEFIAAIRGVPRLSWRGALTLDKKVNNVSIAPATKPIKGRVFTEEQLKLFFNTCLNDVTADEKWTALLVISHAGLGIREIRRLREDKDLFLNTKFPHIIFRGGDEGITKTAARPRVVPIVLGLEIVKKWLPQSIRWMNNVDENSPSVILNQRLRELMSAKDDPTIKTHSFRHTWLRLARHARISEENKHAIAGWERGDTNNAVMERVYDPAGFTDDPELLRQLHEDQQLIFSRFIVDQAAVENVVELKR